MPRSRREFLTQSTLGMLAAAAVRPGSASQGQGPGPSAGEPTPGAPPAFGTTPPAGPEVSTATFAEAEKIVQAELKSADRELAASTWRSNMGALYERRTGPRKAVLEPSTAPWSRWEAVLPGEKRGPERDQFIFPSTRSGPPCPPKEDEIAFAPVTKLSRWIELKKLKSWRGSLKFILAASKNSTPSCTASLRLQKNRR